MTDITDADYKCPKRACRDFKIKNVGAYHNLYAQRDILLVAEIFEDFRNKCIKIHESDTGHFLSTTGLAWKAAIKRAKVLLMVEKGNRDISCYSSICKS